MFNYFRKPSKPATKDRVAVNTFDNYVWDETTVETSEIENFQNILPRFLDGKRLFLVEPNRKNGDRVLLKFDKYKEFVPRELPLEHRDLTPQWLFAGLDWKSQAQELAVASTANVVQKISIGLAIGIIIFALIILFLILVVAMG